MNSHSFILPAIKDQSPKPKKRAKVKLPCTFAHKGEFKSFSPLPIMIQEQKIRQKPKGNPHDTSKKKLVMNM